MSRYDDIIHLPRPESKLRKRMSMEQRAAQFAPFAALNGHEEAIAETARLTFQKPELTVEEAAEISRRLRLAFENQREIEITYYEPDLRKAGGEIKVMSGRIKRIDETEGLMMMEDKRIVSLRNLLGVK